MSVLHCYDVLLKVLNITKIFQFGLVKIIDHDEALTILSRTMDPSDPTTMLESVRLLAAVSLVPPNGYVSG